MIKKKQEEEAARAAAAKKEAQTRRVEAERLAKEHVERQKREQEQKAARLKKEEEDRQRAEELEKKMSERGRVGAEWRRWTEKQKWMKKEVIEPVKADRELKTGLRMGMRLITRGLGQVVNTRESVVRVVSTLGKAVADTSDHRPTQNPLRTTPI
jgi:nucleoporin GLE1